MADLLALNHNHRGAHPIRRYWPTPWLMSCASTWQRHPCARRGATRRVPHDRLIASAFYNCLQSLPGHGVGVFHRFALMRGWHQSANLPFSAFVTADGLHMNDWGYDCIARQIAGAIGDAAPAFGLIASR